MTNEQISLNDLKKMLTDSAKDVEAEQIVIKSAEQLDAEREVNEWKDSKQNYVSVDLKEFNIPKRLLRVLMNTKEYDGLIIHGEGGVGKTVSIVSETKNLVSKDDWIYCNGYSTPLALYETLYVNRNKKLIVFDDVEGIFENKISMSILKGALSETDGQRMIQYNTKSNKAEHLSSSCIVHAKIVILCNDIPREYTTNTQAFLSRVMVYKPQFSYDEKLLVCEKFLEARIDIDKLKQIEIMQLIRSETSLCTKDFSFRTLKKAIAIVLVDSNPRELFQAITTTDDTIKAYQEAIACSNDLSEQIMKFSKLCSKSRATFYRIQKQISKSHQNIV